MSKVNISMNYSRTKEDPGVETAWDFPPESRDLSVTEHFWGHFKEEEDEQTLWNIVQWDNVGNEGWINLQSPCSSSGAVIKANKEANKY